jgi:serine/threonine protein kinase
MCSDYAHRLTLGTVVAPQGPILLQNGRYVLSRQLGAGFFGEVWYGRDVVQDAEVAVKLLPLDVNLDPTLLQQTAAGILLETRLMTRLRKGDRIVTIRNVEIEPPLSFIVMDYLAKGSIGRRLDEARVSLTEAVRWTREALDGLAYAHGLGVIHRDIKPANLLLDDEERVLLTDFGIAEDTVHGLLVNGAMYVQHAAPELLAGSQSSVQSDIFAMGCTLYRLLTGEFPFQDPGDAARGVLRDPHLLNPQIPLSLTRVIRRALAPDPVDRYANAREMIDALIDCGVTNSWSLLEDGDTLETWQLIVDGETYELTVTRLRNGSFRVRARRDKGSGFREFYKNDFPTRPKAAQARRKLLVLGVEGKRLT